MTTNNIDNNKFQKNLNEYLSTDAGIEESAKVLPMLLGGFVNNVENNISDLGQQSLVVIDSIQKLTEAYSQSGQIIEEQDKRIAKLEMMLGIQGKGAEPQPTGQVQPTQPVSKQGGDLADLSSLLGQMRQSSQGQSQQG